MASDTHWQLYKVIRRVLTGFKHLPHNTTPGFIVVGNPCSTSWLHRVLVDPHPMDGGTRFPEEKHTTLPSSLRVDGKGENHRMWKMGDTQIQIHLQKMVWFFLVFGHGIFWQEGFWVPPSPFLFLFEMLLLFASLHFALPPRQDAGLSPFCSRKMNTPSLTVTPKTHPRQTPGLQWVWYP